MKDWISTKKELPKAEYGESATVIATCEWKDRRKGNARWTKELYFNGGNWCHPTGEVYEERVVAWMQKPVPYEGD